jgi:hypothetical protein
MTHATGETAGREELVREALRTLAGYLELSLDAGASLIVIRHANDTVTFYVGDPSGPREELKRRGTAASSLANEMLNQTRVGMNVIEIDDVTYRFFRSFTLVEEAAAVVFAPT